ncbi:dUTP diphosphatase [Neobacillus sp. YIM B02564]|uniref:dUTP diphosphatase n=1 Tax=Neobacillus paridis TaxID=2803862 RepID=A0ABS1TIH2_9BACI|nr:dUTP diphosphatase [Neobacillus paridis]MBL4951112.1 dUTP diphosphatase [Neobacillus paridis]
MNKRFKVNDYVWVHPLKTKAKLYTLNRDNNTAKVEIITSFNKETGERTTKLETVKLSDLSPYRDKKGNKNEVRKPKETLLFAKVRPTAIIPSKNYEDAGYDIYCDFDETELVIKPNEVKLIPTGIASCMSPKYVLVIKERGSTGTNCMSVRAGIIDSGFRNEIFVPINNTSNKTIVITKDKNRVQGTNELIYPYEKAIAQGLLLPVPNVEVKEITYEELQKIPSKRGLGMLGSSGK